ncbi:Isochorismatase domain-containing protein 2 [Hypsizygus marmoreus]|uniref:Isochorismatase domain-containing protein 2 n=1 Tax=Hypsizygus marmoreus TaxID=39966 RepID=A0A369JM52_HYPMA|nr:Isochorismatase domain-containing protein 2 [Hypsizygus marmoreus]
MPNIPTPESTIFFVCDLQTRFQPAIYGFDQVVSTANKLVKLAKILGIEVLATTQYGKVFGPVDPGVGLDTLGPLHLGTFDKTLFSMVVSEVVDILTARPHIKHVVIFGIEAQICVLQTTLSLLSLPNPPVPYIIADGTSSSNTFELPILFERLRQEGAVVTTSESLGFQLVGTSSNPKFREFSQYVKDYKDSTTLAGEVLLLGKAPKTEQEASATNEQTA